MAAREGLNQFGMPAGDSVVGIGLLQRVCNVHNDRASALLLHHGYAAHIDHEVAVSKHCTAVGDGYGIVAALSDFFDGEMHRFGCQKLPFLDVDHLAGVCGGHQQVGLAA